MVARFVRALKEGWQKQGRISYAQCGEDLIVAILLRDLLKIPFPTYLDIGAHHPVYLSNTFLLYKLGCHGVCVEPDTMLLKRIKRKRRRDICLNVGVGITEQKSADFYVLSTRTLNTFSREEAELQVRTQSHTIDKIIQIPLVPIDEIIQKNFESCPNFISLDTEGMDLPILKSFNFEKFRPEVFCVETLTHPHERKVTEILAVMRENDYFMYADTYINTIFVEKATWQRRGIPEVPRLCLQQPD
jgi:FkbM family methyltransferase